VPRLIKIEHGRNRACSPSARRRSDATRVASCNGSAIRAFKL